jgi:predicted metalloprotease with PDZ domain
MRPSSVARALALAATLLARPLGAQRSPTDTPQLPMPGSAPVEGMRYEITVDRAGLAARRLHVVTSFDVGGTDAVALSLPAWTPGAYEIVNFARTVSGFGARQGSDSLRWDKADYDTWRVWPTGKGRVTVTFDVTADTLDNGMSWTRPDFALFNGTNVFLYPDGRSADFASSVTIRTEPDFLIATGMTRGSEARTFRAPNYHELVDMPFFVGRFDLDSSVVSGKTVRFATYPSGSFAGQARATAWEQIRRSIPPEVLVFGEVPWDSYTVMWITDSVGGGMSGLEHANSHVDVSVPQGIGSEFQPRLFAHEIFHAWNVKRLRPADLVPYRYDRAQPTPWLWVSEGVTDYYADLAQVRGGIVDPSGFYGLLSEDMAQLAQAPPFAVEDASLSAWIKPRDGTDALYYPKGALAGFLLDIMIRDASEGRSSLDDVMRDLYRSTYKQGRGFTGDDWWGAVRRASNGRSYDDFARRYIDGREPYPWDETLRVVGLRLQPDSVPRMGIGITVEAGGGVRITQVMPNGAAAGAGIQSGDVIETVNQRPAIQVFFGNGFREMYGSSPSGTPIPVSVKRGEQTLSLQVPLRFGAAPPRIVEDAAPSRRALRLRNGLLHGTTDR